VSADNCRADDETQKGDGCDPVVNNVLKRAPGLWAAWVTRKDARGGDPTAKEHHEHGRCHGEALPRQDSQECDTEGGEHQASWHKTGVVHEKHVRHARCAELTDHVCEMAISRSECRADERDHGEKSRSRDTTLCVPLPAVRLPAGQALEGIFRTLVALLRRRPANSRVRGGYRLAGRRWAG
jgi:hypothetical protein